MKLVRNLAVVAAAVAALVVPAAAFAHGSVYTDVALIDTNPASDQFTLANQTRHVVTNHGFTMVLRETNGAADMGMTDYSRLPGDYRKTLTFSQQVAEGDTAAQPHATCRGVAVLETEAAIRGWQGTDPFYYYVPFQKGPAGLEDDPALWIEDVLALTGVDLATVADPAASCAGLGGTYVPADQTQSSVASLASGSVHPLEEEIVSLETDLAAADAEVAQLRAEVAQLKAEATRLQIDKGTTASSVQAASAGTTLKLTGPAGKSALVRLLASNRNQAKKLGLKSRVLGSGTVKFGADGTGSIKITPSGRAASALKSAKGEVKVLYQAVAGDRMVAIRSTLQK
jgi:hypothetical protein